MDIARFLVDKGVWLRDGHFDDGQGRHSTDLFVWDAFKTSAGDPGSRTIIETLAAAVAKRLSPETDVMATLPGRDTVLMNAVSIALTMIPEGEDLFFTAIIDRESAGYGLNPSYTTLMRGHRVSIVTLAVDDPGECLALAAAVTKTGAILKEIVCVLNTTGIEVIQENGLRIKSLVVRKRSIFPAKTCTLCKTFVPFTDVGVPHQVTAN